MMLRSLCWKIATLAFLSGASTAMAGDSTAIMARLRDPDGGLIVMAHRGCHAAAPRHGLTSAPENSRQALEHCVRLGVDVMETDVRRTRDGYLVIMHDDTVDRTTGGQGSVSQLTLAQVRNLRLREDMGGPETNLTDETVLTLDEMLSLAKGRIVLNLDVKASIYAEVVDAVLRQRATDRVIVMATVGLGAPPLASVAPFDQIAFMPILESSGDSGADLPELLDRQTSRARKPIGIELPRISLETLPAIAERARAAHVRLGLNSLWDGFAKGVGGDVDALRYPDPVWGRLYRAGISIIQTDEPEALLRYRDAELEVRSR